MQQLKQAWVPFTGPPLQTARRNKDKDGDGEGETVVKVYASSPYKTRVGGSKPKPASRVFSPRKRGATPQPPTPNSRNTPKNTNGFMLNRGGGGVVVAGNANHAGPVQRTYAYPSYPATPKQPVVHVTTNTTIMQQYASAAQNRSKSSEPKSNSTISSYQSVSIFSLPVSLGE